MTTLIRKAVHNFTLNYKNVTFENHDSPPQNVSDLKNNTNPNIPAAKGMTPLSTADRRAQL